MSETNTPAAHTPEITAHETGPQGQNAPRPMPDPASIRRILVTAYGHIADVLPSGPALRALRAAYPQARITVLAVGYVKEMLEACPSIDEVIIFEDFKHKGTRRGKVEQLLKLAQWAPRLYGRFDMALVFHARSRFLSRLAWLSGAKVRAGFLDVASASMLTHPAQPFEGIASFRDENRRVLEAVGVTSMPESLELWPSASDEEAITTLFKEHQITDDEVVIGLHPGSHWTCQQWSPKEWAKVADDLISRYQARIIITGADDERDLAAAIINQMAVKDVSPVDVTGRTSILQFAALLKRLNLLICVNSAASQVGLAVGTPTLNLVGYENPVWTAPLKTEPMTIIRGCDDSNAVEYWCPYHVWGRLSQCHRAECVGIGGLSLITPAMVLRQAQRQLTSHPARKQHSVK
ncbi:MAG TPA: glycosyltransferase family 9 protein [Ktedonobacterales bacterium]